MNAAFNITLYPAGTIHLSNLDYVIIGARENDKWIFVRHKERNSWELPAGHIEINETALEAASRELFEETGSIEAEIEAVIDYSGFRNGQARSGRIFFATVLKRGPIPESEIAEIRISKNSPSPYTYPEAHVEFISILEKFVNQQQL